jgi:hypothetical protein
MIGPFKESYNIGQLLPYPTIKGKKELGRRWLWETVLRHPPNIQG